MKVQLENSEVEVNKLPIGRYSELLAALRNLPSKLNGLTGKTNKEIIQTIPDLIATNLPEAIQIIHIGTGMPEADVNALGLVECIDLIVAIIEVNKYSEVYEKIKKVGARLQTTEVKKTEIGS